MDWGSAKCTDPLKYTYPVVHLVAHRIIFLFVWYKSLDEWCSITRGGDNTEEKVRLLNFSAQGWRSGSIPRLGVICGLSLLVLYSAHLHLHLYSIKVSHYIDVVRYSSQHRHKGYL